MKKRNLPYRIIAAVLSFAMILQGGIVMPVFADGKFTYRLWYNEKSDDKISSSHPIIIPDKYITEDGAEAHVSYDGNGVIDSLISDWGPEPYRIVGYTFDGWYTADTVEEQRVDKDTPITGAMIDNPKFNSMNLYGKWVQYGSPDITSNSVTFDKRNANDEDITDEIEWTDINGTPITSFDSNVTDYYAYVYGNMASVRMSFEQYEPDGDTEITVNENSVAKTSEEYINGEGYWYESQGDGSADKLVKHNIKTGKKIVTDYMPLEYTSDSKVYNEIAVKVILPNGNNKTYTFHIKRLTKELKVAYGNTPYGRIMNDNTSTQEQKVAAKALFDSNLSYRNANYNSKAWNIYGDSGVEVKKGTALSENQYINYDKDETAIIVFSGDSFTDPGVTLYDKGAAVEPTPQNPIKRTITYEKVNSLKYSFWNTAVQKTDEKNLTGADGENVIDILKNNYVKPGIYTIDYTYEPDGERPLIARRYMIVLPKEQSKSPYQYDINMDNYVNALDVFVYDREIPDNHSISENLYKYRILDVSPNGRNNGTVDSTDKEYVINKKSILSLYPSYSIEESVSQQPYSVPGTPDADTAQLYMDFLGTDGDVIADINSKTDNGADASETLEKNDIFYVGYRFDNAVKLGTGDLKEITISINYDSRYVKPTATTTSALLNYINKYNSNLGVFNIVSVIGGEYTVDNSTASKKWNNQNDNSQVKTLTLEMHLKDGSNFNLLDGYFLKLPFTVTTVPANDGRSVISTQLGANNLNMAIGDSEYMWDTSDALNTVTKNLMSSMQYMGDYIPNFTAEAAAIVLSDAEYGKDAAYSGFAANASIEGTIPDGLTYTPAAGTISGIPSKAGEFIFYVNGVKYSITVQKAQLRVIAVDKEKTYGNANPELTLTYDETCLKNGDDIDKAVQQAPTLVCNANKKTWCQDNYPIEFNENTGSSNNYYFTFINGNLKITPKQIKITDVKIPPCSINATFPYTFTATAKGDVTNDFTAEGIINEDKIMLSYKVTYPLGSGTVGQGKTVNVSDIKIIQNAAGYEAGKNYTTENTTLTSSKGEVQQVKVKSYSVTSPCRLKYTYGEPLDLNTGNIHIVFDNNTEVDLTFEQAKSNGFIIKYRNTDQTEANNGDHLCVSDTGTALLIVGPESTGTKWTNPLEISKKDLHIKADDKVRYYGDDNSYVHDKNGTKTGFTYSFTESDIVNAYGDTTANIAGFTAPTFSCDALPSTEIDKENGHTEVPIVLSGGSSDNYNIVCENGTLTINKRPLTISQITSGVPALTAAYYMNSDGSFKTAPYKVSASAVAGTLAEGETASMTVTNLYNNDSVKINYNAQYVDCTAADSVSVTVADAEMDDNYGKNYNYTVAGDSTKTATGGRVYVRKIKAIEVTEAPTTDYTYGEPLDLATGNIHITYDSGQEHDINFNGLSAHTDLKLVYTGTENNVVNDYHLIVNDSGKTMTLTADSIYEDVKNFSWTSDEIEVEPHELHVKADDIYTTYGEDITEYTSGYTYTYTASDFQYGETEATITGYTAPTIVCKEDDGTTDANQRTLAGVYTMKISDAAADNYKFVYTNGNLTIRQRPLIVTTVNDIWTLSSEDARDKKLSKNYTIDTKTDNTTLTFAENYGPLWDDYVRISYTASYTEDEAATQAAIDNATVNISGAVLDRQYGDARNYYLQTIKTPQQGKIEGAKISDIEITTDPTKNADGSVKEYSYGDTLDLSSGRYEITFDSGRVDSNVTLDELDDYGITATYTGTTDEVEDGVFVTIDYHNNKTITLTPPSDATADEVTTGGEIKVNKRKMHVIVNDASYTYGDGPAENTYTFTFDTNDLAPGENIVSAFDTLGSGYTPPVLFCTTADGVTPGNTTDAGTYTDAITASGGESHNYEFVCNDEDYAGTYGTLTINKRDLRITAINSGIPTLTAAEAYDHNYVLPIKLDGTAVNNQLQIDNLKNNDEIKIVYKAVYNSLDQADSEPVDIEDVDFAEDCASKKNYNLVAVPADSNGKILTRLMSEITVNSDPDKMEYTYGEWFILSGGSVDIKYNSGYVEQGVTFDNLKNFGIDINFVKTDDEGNEVVNGEVRPNTLLTVPLHDGARIKLTHAAGTQVTDDIQPAYSGEISVAKHKMSVAAEDKSITYGDSAPEYTWHYTTSDLVNGDSLTSGRFTDSLINPTVSCTVDGENITSRTTVGEYDIVPTVGSSANYEFVPVNGTLTIGKKDLKITAITNGVPILTSEIIYQNGGVAPITIKNIAAEYTAQKQQMTLDGVINNDEIGITYSAVYNSIDAGENVEVGIKDAAFDTSHTGNSNYTITEVTTTATGGTIREEQITSVTMTKDPTLRDDTNAPIQYTYGDMLNLNRGAVTVTYDSGRVLENLKFNELTAKTDGKITLVYTDGTEERAAADNDVMYASYHNGKKIKLNVTTQAQNVIEPETAALVVNKAEITVTAKDDEKYYGDANPVLEFEYSSGFVNGDDENSENFRLDLTEPEISCNALVKSPIGTYDIVLSGGVSANYTFKLVPATLTVNKRPLDVEAITGGIPALTAKIIYDEPQLVHKLNGTAINTAGQLKLGNLSGNDAIKITYTVMYTSVNEASNVLVNISDVVLDSEFGDGGNYELRDKPSTALGGNIYGKQIAMVEITTQPKLEYTYGEPLDLSSNGVRITYDSGLVVSNIAFSNLASYGVDITCTDNDGVTKPVNEISRLTVPKHNGMVFVLTPQTTLNNALPAASKPIIVNKKAFDVNVSDASSVYGDDPTTKFEFAYDETDFEYGETTESTDFTDNLIEPVFLCRERDGKTDVNSYSDVGSYTISVQNGSSDNYRFVYHDGTLRVTKRPITISNITGGIPELTSDIIFANPGVTHKLDATADNSQLEYSNVVNSDDIRIKYKAVYSSEIPNDSYNVGIEYVSMDDDYGKSYNYQIDTANSTAAIENGGVIHDKEITAVEVVEQPKLEYTYGDTLNLSGGSVKITYDSGLVEENLTFDELSNHRITITYEGTSDTAASGDVLTVPYHNGKKLILTPRTVHEITPASTSPIKVNKKTMNVYADEVTSVYGDAPILTFTYDKDDFENGETDKSADFTNGLTAPDIQCLDGEVPVSAKSDVGEYTVTLSGGVSNNYEFVCHENTLTITKRPITISNITGGIPELTSDIIFANPGEIHKLDATADNSQLECSNVANNDDIRIKYKAVYLSEESNSSCDVGIEYVSMDDDYGKSYNYQIDTANSTAAIENGGVIHDKEITAVEVVEQPKLEYTYGDTLNLSGGSVKITYDSGLVEENLTFDELSNHRITITYEGTSDTAASGDVLTVPYHNGKKLILTPRTVHEITPAVTNAVSVQKRVLEYGDCIVNPIVYDGSTTETTGIIIFTNPQNGDNVTATGSFAFDDFNAGEDKTVYITDIKLDEEFTANYKLSADKITAVGEIEKAQPVPSLTAEDIELSEITNGITINAPAMTQMQLDGGAEYEYSSDGGITWQKSNIFENLELDNEYSICIRFAETDNFKQSDATTPTKVKTYKNKITLLAKNDEQDVLKIFFTNIESVKDENELKALIGDVEVVYYQLYGDAAGKTKITYPFALDGDMVIYASITKPKTGGGGSGGSGTATATLVPTVSPTVSPTDEPAVTTAPTANPEPAATEQPELLKPYMSGYEDMIKPDDYMTRAEAATIMVNISGDTEGIYENIFTDVRSDTWYVGNIAQANAKGFISGFEDGLFRPEDTVTREQFVSMIVRLIGLEPVSGASFVDVDADRWSAGYINAAVISGIISGYEGGVFDPENPIRRSEAARMTNMATGRIPDKTVIDEMICPFVDLPKEHWAYYELMTASCDFQ